LIIWGGGDSRFSFQSLTRWRPIQLIGDISYSLYLWHWPIIILTPYLIHQMPNRTFRVGMLLASIVIAWLSYRLIEIPFQKGWQSMLFWRRGAQHD